MNNVFYRNTARGSKSPYNMYFGGCYDCVDAEATSDNTEGWYNWGRIGELHWQSPWHCPVYFNQLKRSTFSGISPTYSTMGITLRVENETKNYRGIGDYGTEIRDNTIDRAACSNKNQRLAGNAAIATFNQSWMKVTADDAAHFRHALRREPDQEQFSGVRSQRELFVCHPRHELRELSEVGQ